MAKEKGELSREEDYRAYLQKDVDQGWPYDDKESAAPEGEDPGFRMTRADADGLEHHPKDPVLPETDHREDSDQLESDISEVLELMDDIDMDSIDIHVDGRTVTLTGGVDTLEDRRAVELKVLGVAGVAKVRNQLRTRGVDTHIPMDGD